MIDQNDYGDDAGDEGSENLLWMRRIKLKSFSLALALALALA